MYSARPLVSAFVLALLLTLPACSPFGEQTDAPQYDPIDFSRFSADTTQLVGRWELRQSTVYGPGEPHRSLADTSDRSETLVFPSPDTVRIYRNDTLARQERRQVFLNQTKWGVHSDSLAISTAFRDGPEKIYVRAD